MFTLLLLSALGRAELFALLIFIALLIGYFIGHTHRIFEIANRVYTSLDDRIADDRRRIHSSVTNVINQFEANYATLLSTADRTVDGWEKSLRLDIARELLQLRNAVHFKFTGVYPAYGAMVDPATQATSAENQAQGLEGVLLSRPAAGE